MTNCNEKCIANVDGKCAVEWLKLPYKEETK
jgi:hypothetical protein